MDVLINPMGEALSRCVHVSNHHDVHFKYLIILFANYITRKKAPEGKPHVWHSVTIPARSQITA